MLKRKHQIKIKLSMLKDSKFEELNGATSGDFLSALHAAGYITGSASGSETSVLCTLYLEATQSRWV